MPPTRSSPHKSEPGTKGLRPLAVTKRSGSTVREQGGMLHIRVADSLKSEAATTLDAIGLTTSEAVRLFLRRVVSERRLPLDLDVPNDVTHAAIEEARSMAKRRVRFATPEAMFESLEDERRR